MAEFPVEILRSIFKYLHLKQKLECMLVCRVWARVLVDDGYILETVEMPPCSSVESYNLRLECLIERANQGKNQPGSRCKRLLIDNNMGKIQLKPSALSSAFPSVEMIFLRSGPWRSSYDDQSFNQHDYCSDSDQHDPFCGWRQSLKTVVDESLSGFFFSEVLKTGMMNQLSTFVLRLHKSTHALSNAQIFKQLKNAPRLTTFITDLQRITVDDLEILHDNTPNLTFLTIENDISFDINKVKSLVIILAKQLRIFSLLHFLSIEDKQGLFLYITKKYTHLDDFIIYTPDHLIGNSVNFIWKNLFSTINECAIDIHTNYNFYIHDPPQKHTPPLKILDLSLYSFNALRKNNLSLPVFQCLTTLSVRQIPCIIEYSKFNTLKGLKELTLDYGQNSSTLPIMLDNIINVLSNNIETLCLKYTSLAIERKLVEQQQSGIIHLKLITVKMDKSIPEFMKNYFPKLKSLALYQCDSADSFELSGHNLSHIEITPPNKHISAGVASANLMLTTRNDTFYYNIPSDQIYRLESRKIPFIDRQDRVIHPVLKACARDEKMEYFHFKCGNVQPLYFYDHLVL